MRRIRHGHGQVMVDGRRRSTDGDRRPTVRQSVSRPLFSFFGFADGIGGNEGESDAIERD